MGNVKSKFIIVEYVMRRTKSNGNVNVGINFKIMKTINMDKETPRNYEKKAKQKYR